MINNYTAELCKKKSSEANCSLDLSVVLISGSVDQWNVITHLRN